MNKFNKLYLMNSAVIPQNENGVFKYNTISEEDFVRILKQAVSEKIEIESYVGYPETANHISKITGYVPVISRDIVIRLQLQTPILICRLQYRVQNPKEKALHVPQSEDWNYGLMIKIVEAKGGYLPFS